MLNKSKKNNKSVLTENDTKYVDDLLYNKSTMNLKSQLEISFISNNN